jgi:hypothetical protein
VQAPEVGTLSYVGLFGRLVLGLLFSYSFLAKVRSPARFRASVTAFGLLPSRTVAPAAGLELAAGLGLLVGGPVLAAGYALTAGLLVLFTAALVVALVRRPGIGCGCFGRDERPVAPADLVRNAGFLALAGVGWWSARNPPGAPWPATDPQILAVLALAACAFLLLWTQLAEIVELLAPARRRGTGTTSAKAAEEVSL